MCRLLYHKPKFAILDECTSAVSVNIEGEIYEYYKKAGITLFTVSHRESLINYHEYMLRFDGLGGWSYEKIEK
jgi:ATP-binding cassette subfamily D (ALD) protein 3